MRQQKQFIAWLILGIILCSNSCKKEDKEPQLPPITQNGANTFGCLVNGEVWLPQKGMITQTPYGASNNQFEDKRWLILGNNNSGNVAFYICADSIIKGSSTFGIESLEQCTYAQYSYDHTYNNTDGILNSGKVTILNYDTSEKIIAGTFYFDAINDDGEVVQIRDGRFDLKFTNFEP